MGESDFNFMLGAICYSTQKPVSVRSSLTPNSRFLVSCLFTGHHSWRRRRPVRACQCVYDNTLSMTKLLFIELKRELSWEDLVQGGAPTPL